MLGERIGPAVARAIALAVAGVVTIAAVRGGVLWIPITLAF